MTQPSEKQNQTKKTTRFLEGRLVSLDVFRGIAIAFMILMNNLGGDKNYPILLHADWNGLTLADIFFPFFLFIVGSAIPYSLGSKLERNERKKRLLPKIVRRTIILFALGVFINGFPYFNLSTLRVMGVLQRIALCYLAASCGIWLCRSDENAFYHNTFIDNDIPVISDRDNPFENVSSGYFSRCSWNNSLEGNYWSDYNGTDANSDGIGDTPYIIDQNNTHQYPPWENSATLNYPLPLKALNHCASSATPQSQAHCWSSGSVHHTTVFSQDSLVVSSLMPPDKRKSMDFCNNFAVTMRHNSSFSGILKKYN